MNHLDYRRKRIIILLFKNPPKNVLLIKNGELQVHIINLITKEEKKMILLLLLAELILHHN